MFCCTPLYIHSSIAIILMGKRELVALLNLSSWCVVMVSGSSSGCHGVLCGLWLWYFLIILTYYFNTRNKLLTQKLLKQGYQYHKLRKTFSKFYRRYYVVGVCICSMFCCTPLYIHSSIAIILMGKRELVALLNLSSWCVVMVELLFLGVPWGSLRFVVVVFPDHTHLLFQHSQ